jgi:hypothetical protein
MANSNDMKRRISAAVTASLTVAFIAISGPCAATGYQQASFDSSMGRNRSFPPQQATPGPKPEQAPLRSLIMEAI